MVALSVLNTDTSGFAQAHAHFIQSYKIIINGLLCTRDIAVYNL